MASNGRQMYMEGTQGRVNYVEDSRQASNGMDVDEEGDQEQEENRLIAYVSRDVAIRSPRVVALPLTMKFADFFRPPPPPTMTVEEPFSPDSAKGGGFISELSSIQEEESKHGEATAVHESSSSSNSVDFEREAERMLHKRQREVEIDAEQKAKLTHAYFERQGINLSTVIDTVAGEHQEMHEAAHTIRLKLESERDEILNKMAKSSSSSSYSSSSTQAHHYHRHSPGTDSNEARESASDFIYTIDESQGEVGSKRSRSDLGAGDLHLSDLGDGGAHAGPGPGSGPDQGFANTTPQGQSVSPTGLKAAKRFVSPLSTSRL